jgi:hypothetical protein
LICPNGERLTTSFTPPPNRDDSSIATATARTIANGAMGRQFLISLARIVPCQPERAPLARSDVSQINGDCSATSGPIAYRVLAYQIMVLGPTDLVLHKIVLEMLRKQVPWSECLLLVAPSCCTCWNWPLGRARQTRPATGHRLSSARRAFSGRKSCRIERPPCTYEFATEELAVVPAFQCCGAFPWGGYTCWGRKIHRLAGNSDLLSGTRAHSFNLCNFRAHK